MLRMILGARRLPDEDWVTYVKRTTKAAEVYVENLGYYDWIITQRSRKWRYAGRVATDPEPKWGKRLLSWIPWFRTLSYRDVGRPKKRWDDDLVSYAGSGWQDIAADRENWAYLEAGFVSHL